MKSGQLALARQDEKEQVCSVGASDGPLRVVAC